MDFENMLNEAKNKDEQEWIMQMIKMIICLSKHNNIKNAYENNKR